MGARARHHERDRCPEIERAQTCQAEGAADQEDPAGCKPCQGRAQGRVGAAVPEQGRDRLGLVGLSGGRCGGVGEDPHLVAQGREPACQTVCHMPGLAPQAVGFETEADDGNGLRGFRQSKGQPHAARRSRMP